MRKLTILVCIILIGISVHSQKWENIIGLPGKKAAVMNLLEHYDHGYLITSTLRSGSGANTYWEGWLVKTDINGQILWDKVITTLPDKA
ncbi:MAG TPA: hypothetical protein PK915_12905, partial [Bacteroidales bacterium]|nr:hypothetical protein [Bacteroidales bacterium]